MGECLNIDDCARHTCGAHGDCVDKLQDYECKCASGFEQTTDSESGEKVCGNINDCGAEACGVGKCKDLVNAWECKCPSGYEEVDDGQGPTCKPKLCGVPDEVDNSATVPAEAQTAKAYYGAEFRYVCDSGYTLNGKVTGKDSFEVKCKANTKFSRTKKCEPVKCASAVKVTNAKPKKSSAVYKESIKYVCDAGYTVDGSTDGDDHFSVTCQTNGRFSTVSTCEPVRCGHPDEIANAARPGGSLVFKDKITYECFSGFTLNGKRNGKTSFDIKCKKDGTLSETQSCIPKVCGVPEKKINAMHATTANEGAISYPRVTEVTCKDGYSVGGDKDGEPSFMVWCQADGHFSQYDKRECQPITCGAPPDMQNADFDMVTVDGDKVKGGKHPSVVFGQAAEYKCKEGYTAGGESGGPETVVVGCSSIGEFSVPPKDSQCRDVDDCALATCGQHGVCVDKIGKAPAYDCNCHDGYDVRTKTGGKYGASGGGKYCGNIDECKDADCGQGVCTDLVGDYLCSCFEGYSIGTKDGKKTCVAVSCSAEPPYLGNGKELTAHSGAVDFPTALKYKCDTGYSIDQSTSDDKRKFMVSCKADGTLFGMKACQKIQCPAPHQLPFTKLLTHKPDGNSKISKPVVFDDEAEYECDEGYTIKGRKGGDTKFSVKCRATGLLTDVKVCEAVRCGTTPKVSKARPGLAGMISFGMNLDYTCDAGHTLTGKVGEAIPAPNTFRLECLKDGVFSELKDSCKPVSGGDAPSIKNADMTEYDGKPVKSFPPEVFYPNGLEYKCREGFTDDGSENGKKKITARVNSQGQIVGLPTECKALEYSFYVEVSNAASGAKLEKAKVEIESSDLKYKADLLQVVQPDNYGAVNGLKTPCLTNEFGQCTFRNIPAGKFTLAYTADGFESAKVTVDVSAGTLALEPVALFPKPKEGEWRATVTWGGGQKYDLDSGAFWGPTNVFAWGLGGGYAHKDNIECQHSGDVVEAGSETVSFKGLGTCTKGTRCDVRYVVTSARENPKALMESDATIKLYHPGGVEEFKFSDCAKMHGKKDRIFWHAFTLDGETSKIKWGCNDKENAPANWKPAPKALASGTYTMQQKSNNRYLDAYTSNKCEWNEPVKGSLRGNNIGKKHDGVKSRGACKKLCEEDDDCRSIDYNGKKNRCYLGSADLGDTGTKKRSANGSGKDYVYLDCDRHSVATRPKQGDASQTWVITKIDNSKYYTIEQMFGKMRYLDAYAKNNDHSVVTRKKQQGKSQKWIIKTLANGKDYTIKQGSTERYLDAYKKGSPGKDWNAVTRTKQQDKSQKWIIKDISAQELNLVQKFDDDDDDDSMETDNGATEDDTDDESQGGPEPVAASMVQTPVHEQAAAPSEQPPQQTWLRRMVDDAEAWVEAKSSH